MKVLYTSESKVLPFHCIASLWRLAEAWEKDAQEDEASGKRFTAAITSRLGQNLSSLSVQKFTVLSRFYPVRYVAPHSMGNMVVTNTQELYCSATLRWQRTGTLGLMIRRM